MVLVYYKMVLPTAWRVPLHGTQQLPPMGHTVPHPALARVATLLIQAAWSTALTQHPDRQFTTYMHILNSIAHRFQVSFN